MECSKTSSENGAWRIIISLGMKDFNTVMDIRKRSLKWLEYAI
jgi:hypothetical protein